MLGKWGLTSGVPAVNDVIRLRYGSDTWWGIHELPDPCIILIWYYSTVYCAVFHNHKTTRSPYNTVQYNIIIHTIPPKLENITQIIHSKKTPHSSPPWGEIHVCGVFCEYSAVPAQWRDQDSPNDHNRCGVSVVILKPESFSASIIAVPCVISW